MNLYLNFYLVKSGSLWDCGIQEDAWISFLPSQQGYGTLRIQMFEGHCFRGPVAPHTRLHCCRRTMYRSQSMSWGWGKQIVRMLHKYLYLH